MHESMLLKDRQARQPCQPVPTNQRSGMAQLPPSPSCNRLLAALPESDYLRLLPYLDYVPLPIGRVLYEPGERMQHVYFPASGIVSLSYMMEDGATAEVAVIGNEGLVGMSLLMGGDQAPPLRAVVMSAGHAWRMPVRILREEFESSAEVRRALLRYTQALMMQISQTAVCNRHHRVEQQLCRLLLDNLDRLTTSEVVLTHESIAAMLGVRREGISGAAAHLQQAGLIHYHRGHITVIDRAGLEQRVCECYDVVRRESARLLT